MTSSPLLPFSLPGYTMTMVRTVQQTHFIDAVCTAPTAICPDCHQPSHRVHSTSIRMPRDLPVSTYRVRVCIRIRRFFCPTPTCPRRTFAEQLPDVLPKHAQRTTRLTHN